MRVVRHADAAAFSRVAVPLLTPTEAEHNLLLWICSGLAATPPSAVPPFLATIEDGDRPIAVAIMTPPRKLVLSAAPRAALDALCTHLVDMGVSVPGAVGRVDVAETFGAVWRERTGAELELERHLRIYELTSVMSPRPVSGRFRQAGRHDLSVIAPWSHAFVAETGLVDDAASIADTMRRAVERGRLYVWDDPAPVTMASWAGSTPHGARVTMVFTPPALRGRGYASACVAALSALLLANGRTRCFLFTDLANPTSNSIYAKIGYRPVCDVDEYRFMRRRAG